jgi:hypothetical protein
MSALAKMMADMLLKELPDEVRNALTPENINRLGESVILTYKKWNETLNSIVETQAKQQIMLEEILEKVSNNDGSSNRRRKPLSIVDGSSATG